MKMYRRLNEFYKAQKWKENHPLTKLGKVFKIITLTSFCYFGLNTGHNLYQDKQLMFSETGQEIIHLEKVNLSLNMEKANLKKNNANSYRLNNAFEDYELIINQDSTIKTQLNELAGRNECEKKIASIESIVSTIEEKVDSLESSEPYKETLDSINNNTKKNGLIALISCLGVFLSLKIENVGYEKKEREY